ncbi:MAG TPA: acyclic terpene utilization AtuA family protein [Acidimicrobiales bacterium]|nr:acyclic terpene utilization AtuA family protein [Acidimicrobiales bacterium]
MSRRPRVEPSGAPVLRIANCSGFYGDRLSAAREMVEGGPIDFLTGDYLAELTMLILWKTSQRQAGTGYATTFLRQMEEILGTCVDRGVKVVTNAGGLNPRGLAERLREVADRLGVSVEVAHIEGDDLLGRLEELQASGHPLTHMDTGVALADAPAKPVTANAYLGAWGIVEALSGGADIVVCPRVTDASLVVGPAAWHFGWGRHDWDRLAGAVVAGHILECGAQTTGGNYSFFTEVPGLTHPGFPLAEMHADGSAVITKHEGTGGAVSVGTVTAQLLYEIGGASYPNPDVVARFDTIRLDQEGPDRVRVSGVRGDPAPADTKVCINYVGGYRNTMTFVLTGLDVEAKADLARRTLFEVLGGEDRFGEVDVRLIRTDKPDAPTNEEAQAELRVTLKDPDPTKVGRAFSGAVVEMALASYPGFTMTSGPSSESNYGVYWPALVPSDVVDQVVVWGDGTAAHVEPTRAGTGAGPGRGPDVPAAPPAASPADELGGDTRRVPLGTLFGARSGDKGGNANVGVWARSDAAYRWLAANLTVDLLRRLVPEAAGLDIERHELPNIRAVNFVIVGLLGEGVAASVRPDPQAKSLGEYLRSRLVELPVGLLDEATTS